MKTQQLVENIFLLKTEKYTLTPRKFAWFRQVINISVKLLQCNLFIRKLIEVDNDLVRQNSKLILLSVLKNIYKKKTRLKKDPLTSSGNFYIGRIVLRTNISAKKPNGTS